MAAPPGDDYSLDASLAYQTRLSLAAVHAVLELEKTLLAVGIYVVGNRGPAQLDGFLQNSLDCAVQLPELLASDGGSSAPGPNPCSEQRFVRINIAHPA